MNTLRFTIALTFVLTCVSLQAQDWSIESAAEWTQNIETSDGATVEDGMVFPSEKRATVLTRIHSSATKRSAASLTINQSPIWQNWEPVKNIGPSNLNDAPVLLTIGPDNYWIFGRYGSGQSGRKKKGKDKNKKNAQPAEKQIEQATPFVAEDATLEGFDIPLKTTRFANQFDAPGGLKPGRGGYHAWQSRDMKNWVHHGPVTETFSKWVTNAEQVDGKTLIYYDFPNDQDPHVYVDEDLFDGEPGKNMGMAVKDPSHGLSLIHISEPTRPY